MLSELLSVFAEWEAKQTCRSTRTKQSMQTRKAKGLPIGAQIVNCRNLSRVAATKGSKMGAQGQIKAARNHLTPVLPIIRKLRESGKTLQAIADHLNETGHTTRRGNPWGTVQVHLALKKAS